MRKLTSLFTAMALVTASIVPFSVSADNYATVSAPSTSFDKILVLDEEANVPNATFTYEITAGDAVAGTTSTLAVYSGITATSAPSIDDVVYEQGDDEDATSKTSATGYKTVTKTVEVDFTGINFSEPGIYRYWIQETSVNDGVINDVKLDEPTEELLDTNNTWRTLDVYVEDATTSSGKALKVVDYILYQGKVSTAPPVNTGADVSDAAITQTDKIDSTTPTGNAAYISTGATKSDNYVNLYGTSNLTFGKEVTGNQGSKDKYFEFTLTLSGVIAGTVYDVDITNADATPASNSATTVTTAANPTSITVPAGATTVTQKFYLQDGQYITVKGIAEGTDYVVTENYEDYTQTEGISATLSGIDIDGDDTNDALTDDAEGTIGADDIYTGFTNNRQGIIPTGIIAKFGPVVVIGAILLLAIIVMVIKSKSDDEEEA